MAAPASRRPRAFPQFCRRRRALSCVDMAAGGNGPVLAARREMPHPDRKKLGEDTMRIGFNPSIASLTPTVALVVTFFALPSPAGAQAGDYFASKTLRIIVGLEAGGTAD